MNTPRRVCIATSYPAIAEPRSPRYAAAIARMLPHAEVLYVDCLPIGETSPEPADFEGLPNLRRHTIQFAWRGGGQARLVTEKASWLLGRTRFSLTGHATAAAFSTRAIELRRFLLRTPANLYGGFNIDTLLPVWQAARKHGARFFFDCQEYYSDMAHDQTSTERAIIRTTEKNCLPDCALVLAATPQIAERLEHDYRLLGVLPLDNAPPIFNGPFPPRADGFSLYWRNGVIDLGYRGLAEVLRALALLPESIKLYIQGRPSSQGGGARVDDLIRELRLEGRVIAVPPYMPSEAVSMAAPYSVGLCPEQLLGENLNLTASNKLFDYLMAGLGVVASSTAGLRDVIRRSRAGELFPPSDFGAMADRIYSLHSDPSRLAQLRSNARAFALAEGNLEFQISKLRTALEAKVFGPAGLEIASPGEARVRLEKAGAR